MKGRDLAVIGGCSFAAGALLVIAIDRITFLTGHTFRQIRYADRVAA